MNMVPDPWVVYQDGYFYYMCTTASNLTIWKSPTLEGLKTTPGTVVWTPQGTYANLTDLWAPELHLINRKWYIYFAADTGKDNSKHRIYVVENKAHDPVEGHFEMKGPVSGFPRTIGRLTPQSSRIAASFSWSGRDGRTRSMAFRTSTSPV